MDEKYFAKKVEAKWQKKWAESGAFEAKADDELPKYYALEMLPYPSGNLHMGHVRNYSVGDAVAWFKRLKGFNVLHPFGWDSFGQPAEDAAIKRGVNPYKWTEENIKSMRGQLERMGFSYDWSRQMAAHRPDYYKWDQWFFLKMYEMGLAYKKKTQVNWCETDQATLSNEQASGGLCWRCGNPVTKKDLEQWFLKTTAYADQLLDDMADIESGWPQNVIKRQRDWIGRSTGAYVDFAVSPGSEKAPPANAGGTDMGGKSVSSPHVSEGAADNSGARTAQAPSLTVGLRTRVDHPGGSTAIRVFTTRIDTIYGANAVVLAATHPVIEAHRDHFSSDVIGKIDAIIAEALKPKELGEEIEKDGIDTGLRAVNPFSKEELPVWVGNYVMMEYGTGAVMSVPAHDERDWEFAKKYDLPIRQVISEPHLAHEHSTVQAMALEVPFTEYGVLVHSDFWNGKTSDEAKAEMTHYAETHGFGEAATTYRLRDWGISRQRLWGSPIPIIYCDGCGVVPEKYENLPVVLPDDAPITGTGESPLAKVESFVNVACPQCGGAARRETDTMDTFVDSSWYYYRYLDPNNADAAFDPELAEYWTPVDQYIGGDDHAVMHLIYARFWTKVMRDLGIVKFDEPFKRLLTQGMVVGETFFDDSTGKRKYFQPDQVTVQRDAKGRVISAYERSADTLVRLSAEHEKMPDRSSGSMGSDGFAASGDADRSVRAPLKYAIERMSKSKGNGVDPDEMVDIYGADAARLFVLFAAPVENELVWHESGIEGAVRFLQRVWRFVYKWKGAFESIRGTVAKNPVATAPGSDKSPPATAGGTDISKGLRRKTHQTIRRVEDSLETLQFNTPVAGLMELINALYEAKIEPETATDDEKFAVYEATRALVLMLTPFAPHTAEELFEQITGETDGMIASGARFTEYRPELAVADEIEIAVQVNGKLRSRIMASPEAANSELEAQALADEKVKEFTEGKAIVKVVVVPKRLVNVVVK